MDIVTLALAKKYTNQKFANLVKFGGFKIVEALPTEDISTSTVYLLHSMSPTEGNIYEEYIYTTEGKWESLGTTVDIEGYVTTDALNEALKTVSWNDLQDKPFYEEYVKTEPPMFEDSLTFENYQAYRSNVYLQFDTLSKYIVSINNQEILCRCQTSWISGGIGRSWDLIADNEQVAHIENGEDWLGPFGNISFYFDLTGTYSVKIYDAPLQIFQLEEKYIPDTIATKQYVNDKFPIKWEDIDNRPFGDFVTKGKTYYDVNVLYRSGFGLIETYTDPFISGAQYWVQIGDYKEKLTYKNGYYGGTYVYKQFDGGDKIFVQFQESESAGTGWSIEYTDFKSEYYMYAQTAIFEEAIEARPIDEKYLPATVIKTADLTWDKIENKPFSSEFSKGDNIVSETGYAYNNQLSFQISTHENILVDQQYYVISTQSATVGTLQSTYRFINNEFVYIDGFQYENIRLVESYEGDAVTYLVYKIEISWSTNEQVTVEIFEGIPSDGPILVSYLPMDAIVQAVIAALPRAEDQTI